jgi:hypothetical protein
MVFGGARYPSKMRIAVYYKGFWRFLIVFDNASKMENICILKIFDVF